LLIILSGTNISWTNISRTNISGTFINKWCKSFRRRPRWRGGPGDEAAQLTRRPNLQGVPTYKASQLTRRPNLQGIPTYKASQLTRCPNLQGVPTYEVSHTVDPVPLGLPIVLWMETKYYKVLWRVFCFLRMLNFLSKYNI
jgi:hypothetical protein